MKRIDIRLRDGGDGHYAVYHDGELIDWWTDGEEVVDYAQALYDGYVEWEQIKADFIRWLGPTARRLGTTRLRVLEVVDAEAHEIERQIERQKSRRRSKRHGRARR